MSPACRQGVVLPPERGGWRVVQLPVVEQRCRARSLTAEGPEQLTTQGRDSTVERLPPHVPGHTFAPTCRRLLDALSGRDPCVVLFEAGQRAGAQHLAAQLAQPLQQHRLGDRLGHQQRIGEGGREPIEGHRHEHPVAIADREPPRADASLDQLLGDAVRIKHLESAGVDHGRPRGVSALSLLISDGDVAAARNQRDSNAEPDRTGAGDQNIGRRRKHALLQSVGM